MHLQISLIQHLALPTQKFISLVGTVAILAVKLFHKFAKCYVDFVVLDHDIISVKLLNLRNAH